MVEEAKTPGYSLVEAAKKRNISHSTLSGILKEKDKVLEEAMKGHTSHLCQGHAYEKQLERLYDWFLKKRSQGILLDRPLLQKQAENMAKEMGLTPTISFSHGWEVKFR